MTKGNWVLFVCIIIGVIGSVDYILKTSRPVEKPVPEWQVHAEHTAKDFQFEINRINARIDESFQNHQFSEDMRDEINLVIKDLHTVVDANQKRITALEAVKEEEEEEEEVPLPPVEVVAPKVPESPTPQKPVVVAPESFAAFAAREYRGVSWVESGRGDATVNHLVNTHGWNYNEVSKLSRHQRMRIHGVSHSGQTSNMQRKYKARYGL
jgi:hypothetical protein